MLTFLEESLNHIQQIEQDLSSCTLILPSKRAGGFLKNLLRKQSAKTQFLPSIISIEELIEELSGLQIIDKTELLFKSYEVYQQTATIANKDSFEEYTSWASTLLNDFNEADRYLLNTDAFFDYLGNIKTMERWNVSSQKTNFIENYVRFWKSLPEFYENLKTSLLKSGIAYQGLVYREAVANIEHYLTAQGGHPHYFIGFNALNTAEQQLIQAFLEFGHAEVLWDTEKTFVEDSSHSASLFIRRYLKEWKYYVNHTPNFISDNYSKSKQISIVEGTKNMSQLKYVGQLLKEFSVEKLNRTAIVLADENLLLPLLHSLPNNITGVNVTMGASLKNFPGTIFFDAWLRMHVKNKNTFYYKDVIKVLGHPLAARLINTKQLLAEITSINKSYFTLQELTTLSTETDTEIIELLFRSPENDPKSVVSIALELIVKFKEQPNNKSVERSVLFELYKIFKDLEALQQRFQHIHTLQTFQEFFKELIASTTIDFKGEAFEGLQVMGVLETRALDFENIIVLSVNEGILPSGKSNASFITYDLKKEFNLPLYTEKDAIYTYHFYHMLHRAKEVTLVYTNFSEGISSGEKSRFLLQLEIEKQPNHILQKRNIASSLSLKPSLPITIAKTVSVLSRLKEIAANGFSPSALTSYIRNPVDFYFQKVLKVREFDEVEETVAFNTLGTIVHDTLEKLYAPYVQIALTTAIMTEMRGKVVVEVENQFANSFKGGDISTGKNLLIFEVAKRYVENMIDLDTDEIKNGNEIIVQKIESNLKIPLTIPELDFPVYLHGKVDRVDSFNGQVRIIDYKTGKVDKNELNLINWDELSLDYKYSKAFQVLCYALMMSSELSATSVEAGIISFKNMGSGFIKFATKEAPGSKAKNSLITSETLELFKIELKKLILEICTMDIPFTEKEIN